MLCKRGLCRHLVSVRVSVCVCLSVTFVDSVKTNKRIFNFFSSLSGQAILFFPNQTAWQYSDGNPLMGASNAGGVGRNRDSEPKSGFTACCQRCVRLDVINTRRRPRSRKLWHIAGSKQRSLLMAGDDDEMFMTRNLNVTPKTREQHIIARSVNLLPT